MAMKKAAPKKVTGAKKPKASVKNKKAPKAGKPKGGVAKAVYKAKF